MYVLLNFEKIALHVHWTLVITSTIPGVPNKAERRVFSTLQARRVILFYIIS